MDFEFDQNKSAANLAKHGIDFKTAQKLWEKRITEVPVVASGEWRLLVIGRIGEQYWTAVVTQRENRMRIISVRRSREKEKKIYEQA